jgi:hypothetical protein
LPSRARKKEDEVTITSVRKKCDRFDEICVQCRLGSLKFTVSLPADEFTAAALRKEIGRKLLCEFGARYAKSMVGRTIPLAEIVKETDGAKHYSKFWDFF